MNDEIRMPNAETNPNDSILILDATCRSVRIRHLSFVILGLRH
jgi:hypothetical protein